MTTTQIRLFSLLTAVSLAFIFIHFGPRPVHADSQHTASPSITQSMKDFLVLDKMELLLHAQQTFHKYTRKRPVPEWEYWQDQCDLGLLVGCPSRVAKSTAGVSRLFDSLIIPPQLIQDSQPSQTGEASGVPKVLQSIYYNPSAAKTIMRFGLKDPDSLEKRLDGLAKNRVPLSDMNLSDFETDAVIVKTIWETIRPLSMAEQKKQGVQDGQNYQIIHLYDSTLVGHIDDDAMTLNPISTWPTSKVDINKPGPCAWNAKTNVYNLGCFDFRPITRKTSALLREDTSHFPDFVTGPCKDFAGTCYLVLVGIHIITRETPNWTWMTYWFTNEDRIVHPSEKWAYFKASASINNMDAVANPYLEGPRSGMRSNCLECHRFAEYKSGCYPDIKRMTGLPNRPVKDTDPPDPLATDLQNPPDYFGGALQTHLLWTLALKQSESVGKPDHPLCPIPTLLKSPGK